MPDVRCYSVNISEGGMALSTFVPLSPGEEVQVQFTLPDHKVPFLAESRICWLKGGQLGVRFVSLLRERQSELQDWLSQKLEETLPELVADQFQKADGVPYRPRGTDSRSNAVGAPGAKGDCHETRDHARVIARVETKLP